MFRTWLLWMSQSPRMRRWVTQSRVGRRVARRFVAGETLEEGMTVAEELARQGFRVTLAHLGEWVHTPEDAHRAAADIRILMEAIAQRELPAYVSVKLSHLGVHLDRDLARSLLRDLLEDARRLGLFVRIDMEESVLVEPTLQLQREMWAQGLTNVGVVIQAYLYRSEGDLRRLLEEQVPVRLVKGAYKEPPQVALTKKRDVDANFDRLTRLLLEGLVRGHEDRAVVMGSPDGRRPPLVALATHDENRLAYARECMQRLGLSAEGVEFQMLYGVRRDLQGRLLTHGHPVRIYVPFGQEWYPYFMRRLAERPANLWFFLRHLFRG